MESFCEKIFFCIFVVFFGIALWSIVQSYEVNDTSVICTVEDAYISNGLISEYVIVVSVNGEKVYKVSGMDEYYLFKDLVGEDVNATLHTMKIGHFTLERIVFVR